MTHKAENAEDHKGSVQGSNQVDNWELDDISLAVVLDLQLLVLQFPSSILTLWTFNTLLTLLYDPNAINPAIIKFNEVNFFCMFPTICFLSSDDNRSWNTSASERQACKMRPQQVVLSRTPRNRRWRRKKFNRLLRFTSKA